MKSRQKRTNMKSKLFTLLACVAMILSACKNNAEELNLSSKHYMQLDILGEEYESDKPFPCTVLDFDEWVLVEYTTDGLDYTDVMPFLCVNKIHDVSYLLLGYENGVVLTEFDMKKKITGENAIFMSSAEGYNRFSLAKIKYEDGLPIGYEIVSEITEQEDNTSNKTKSKNYQDDYSSSIVKTIAKHLNEFDSKVSLWIDATGNASGIFKGNIKAIGWAITGVINAVRLELLEVPGLNESTKNDIKSDIGESIVLSVIKRSWRMMYNAELYALKKTALGQIFIDQFQEWHDALTKEEPIDEIPMFASNRVIDNWQSLQTGYAEQVPKYILSLSLYSVGETTATLSASYKYGYDAQMSYVSSMGIECWNKSTGEKVTLESNLSSNMQLADLQPLTEYICCAYMTSFGTKYRSNCVDFITKGDLTLTPAEVNFSTEGGIENIFFSILRHNIAAWDYTAPNWCKIEKYEDWFRVVVGENTGKKALAGNVNISMALKSGKKTHATLKISQAKPNVVEPGDNDGDWTGSGDWNGTTWYFSNGSTFDFNFTINNLASQNVIWGGFLNDNKWAKEATVIEKTDDGLFIGKQGPWNGVGIHSVEINIVRTSRNTATADLTYRTIPIFGNGSVETVTLNGKQK